MECICAWGDSNDATYMLSSEYFVYTITCRTLLSSVYMVDDCKYDTSDFAVIRDMIQLSIYSDDSKSLHVMV